MQYVYGPDSSVSIATGYELDGPEIESRWGGGQIFRTCPDRTWGPRSFLYNGYRGVQTAGAWDWPPTPSIAEVLERVELYLYPP